MPSCSQGLHVRGAERRGPFLGVTTAHSICLEVVSCFPHEERRLSTYGNSSVWAASEQSES